MDNLSILDDTDALNQLTSSVPLPDQLTPESVTQYRTKIAQLWLEEDFRRGILPQSISCFSETHEYIDANLYLYDDTHPIQLAGSFLNWRWDVYKLCYHLDLVASALNMWIENGRSGDVAEYLTSCMEQS